MSSFVLLLINDYKGGLERVRSGGGDWKDKVKKGEAVKGGCTLSSMTRDFGIIGWADIIKNAKSFLRQEKKGCDEEMSHFLK